MDAIEAEGLAKAYGATTALAGVDLAVPQGHVLGLLGPNGAGKTTAVRILTTLMSPDRGRAHVLGVDVTEHPARVRELIGLAGQYAAVDGTLTGAENLRMVGNLYHLPRPVIRQRSDELLERFELTVAAHRPVDTYSGGMRRRLDLAASLINQPSVLFLDEPTTGLDPRSRFELWDVIEGLVSSGTTVLLTTQYLEEADRLADRISVVDHGRVIAEGSTAELKARTGPEHLDVRLVDEADLEVAQRELLAIAVAPPSLDAEQSTLSVAVEPNSDALVAAVRRLDDADIAIADISLRRPTLDDVFLALTGTRPSEPGPDEPEHARSAA